MPSHRHEGKTFAVIRCGCGLRVIARVERRSPPPPPPYHPLKHRLQANHRYNVRPAIEWTSRTRCRGNFRLDDMRFSTHGMVLDVCRGCVCVHVRHGRSRMIVDLRIPEMPGRSMSSVHLQGRHRVRYARSAVRC